MDIGKEMGSICYLLDISQERGHVTHYEYKQHLMTFLELKINPRKHWSASSAWVMAEAVDHVIMKNTIFVVSKARVMSISCDEVRSIDN